MKRSIALTFLIIIFLGEVKSQTGPCPYGQESIGVSFEITTLNFHRPRFNCESHFGFCVRGVLMPVCPQMRFDIVPRVSKDGIVTGYGRYLTVDSKGSSSELELHLPLALKDRPEFSKQDMSTFEVGDNLLFIGDANGTMYEKVIGGLYPVKEINSELVIKVRTVKVEKN